MAFRVPAYRWLWISFFFNASGFMSFLLAQGWLLLILTDSPLMVGLSPALAGVANLAVSPVAGVLADRWNRRDILIVCQSAMTALALALGFLIIADLEQVWHILLVSSALGIFRGLENPARNTLMYDVVGRGVLLNAMAGQYLATSLASALGGLGAGSLLATLGPGTVLLAIGGYYFLAMLLLLRVPNPPRRVPPPGSVWLNFKEGVGFALHDRPIITVMWVVLITESLGFSTKSMFPVVTRDLLDAGPFVLGLLTTLWAIGGITGAIIFSSFGDFQRKGWVFMAAAFAFGASLILFAFSHNLSLSLMLAMLAGAFGVTYDILATTLLQTLSPEAMRGRVMGLYTFLVSGFSLGSLLIGTLAKFFGITTAIASGGATVTVAALGGTPMARAIGERSAAGWEAPDPSETGSTIHPLHKVEEE